MGPFQTPFLASPPDPAPLQNRGRLRLPQVPQEFISKYFSGEVTKHL